MNFCLQFFSRIFATVCGWACERLPALKLSAISETSMPSMLIGFGQNLSPIRTTRLCARTLIMYRSVLIGATLCAPLCAEADVLRISTWNLGWHISQQEISPWIDQCSKMYVKDGAVWRLASASTPQAKRGWDIGESRANLEGVDLSVMPPCATYTTEAHLGIEVTPGAYATRLKRISHILSSDVRPDIIAFQEVSGAQSVREALGDAFLDYNICSFEGEYKIQRLAFAWKKILGDAVDGCKDIKSISLPGLAAEKRVRPGYVVTLNINGKKVRLLTVHLKSGCVSPLEGGRLDGDTGPDDPCPILQQQARPLEETFEQMFSGADHFIVLGDFNRNLWHEANIVRGAEPVRSDGEHDLTKNIAPAVLTRNLLLEVNDGAPLLSKAKLLPVSCPGGPNAEAACLASETVKLTTAQKRDLTDPAALGCRNPIGLDHILVSKSLEGSVKSTRKISIGEMGRSLASILPENPDPVLAISDHCPMVTEIEL